MAMTPAELAILGAAIAADGELNAFPNTNQGAYAIAELLNVDASPDFTVWKTNVSLTSVGDNLDGSEVASLTTGESNRLQVKAMYSVDGINPSVIGNRAFFDGIFVGGQGTNTRANLAILWRRLATRGEAIFATGTGSDADPATLGREGSISYPDVFQARNLP